MPFKARTVLTHNNKNLVTMLTEHQTAKEVSPVGVVLHSVSGGAYRFLPLADDCRSPVVESPACEIQHAISAPSCRLMGVRALANVNGFTSMMASAVSLNPSSKGLSLRQR